jgi:homocitrate synthase
MRIELIDTTLRDGQQSPLLFDSRKYVFSLEEKIQIIRNLIQLGVRYFELFSPIVSENEREHIPVLIAYAKSLNPDVKMLAHCRCNEYDIQESISAGFDGLNLYIGSSDVSRKSNHGKNLKQVVELSSTIIKDLRHNYPNMLLRFSGEDSFRTPLDTLFQIYDPIYEYLDMFGMPDTVGIATPEKVLERVQEMRKRYPNVNLEGHFHNDRGLSIINSLYGVKGGMNYIDTSIWGLAERSGITSTTAILMNLNIENPEYVEGYELSRCYPVNVALGTILKLHVPHLEPVSLTNRTHIAGVHQKGVMNSADVYEAHSLQSYGVNTTEMLLGPLSGSNLIHYYLSEILNFDTTIEQSKEITNIFKSKSEEIRETKDPEKILAQVAVKFGLLKKIDGVESDFVRLENLGK